MNYKCSYDELVDVHRLVPHPLNPNKHPVDQVDRLSKIIDYQGQRSPVIVCEDTGFIIVGHGRTEAIRLLGWDKVAVNYQKFKDDAQRYAHMTADNAIAEWATLDLSQINDNILNLDTDIDVDLLGLKDFTLTPIEDFEPQADEDAVPEVGDPITKRGDVWLLGNHRLLCGDSMMIDDFEKLMAGDTPDMVYTDPPYGMKLDVNYDKMFKKDARHKDKGDRYMNVIADDRYFDPTDILNLTDHIKEVWLWGADYFYDSLPRGGSLCAWDKRNDSLDKVVGNTTEYLWSKVPHRRMTARVLWSGHHGMGKDDDKKRIHPTQKPITLHDWFFDNFANNKNKILDLFLGSGSTLIACEKTNRICYGMELDEKYCDVIVNRWQNYTGKKAKLESNGKTYDELKESNV